MRRLRGVYGSGVLHLLGVVASFAVVGYAALQILDGRAPLNFLIWFGGAIVLHDFVLFPIYSGIDQALNGRRPIERTPGPSDSPRRSLVNYVRVPAFLSGLLLLVWFPLILSLGTDTLELVAGIEAADYLARWLAITGALFALSGLLLVARRPRARVAPTTARAEGHLGERAR